MSVSSRLRRATALVALPGLVLAAPSALPAGPASAAEPDPAPAAAGASWLAAQLQDGLLPGQFGPASPDYGLTIDAANSLLQVGGQPEAIESIHAAIESQLDKYAGDYEYDFDPDGPGPEPEAHFEGSSANAVAKSLDLALTLGDADWTVNGQPHLQKLESLIEDGGPVTGRLSDRPLKDGQPEPDNDFANVLGQAFAVRALDSAGSSKAEVATEFLTAQQCTGEGEGFFRQDFAAADAPGQTCDDAANPEPSTDATALAVLALLPQADDTDVQAAIDAAAAWLVAEQADNGSFGAGADIPAPNSNSTGLAGWALGEAGETGAAERAAAYLRAFQVDEPAPCSTALAESEGAIAYDGPALTAGRKHGITAATADQWRRASAQALPALQWAPDEPIDTTPSISDAPHRYFQPGERVTLHAIAQTPGDTVCFFLGKRLRALAPVQTDGSAHLTTRLPGGTATRSYKFSTDEVDKQVVARYRVLDATKLRLDLKREVPRGRSQVVRIRGLAVDEHFRAIFRGRRVDAGIANAEGRAVARFKVGRTTGPVRVLVLGEFKNRRASRAFTVTR